MQVTLHIVTVKPETAQWWGPVNVEKSDQILEAIKAIPGFVSYDKKFIDDNTVEQTIVFESIEASLLYRDLWRNNPAIVERKKYNEENLIVTFTTETYN